MAKEPSGATTRQRETFQKFWTKDKTESLLSILEDQAENGDIQHETVARTLSKRLNLPVQLEADQISDRISILVGSFKREFQREQSTGVPSQWRWKQQIHDLIEKVTHTYYIIYFKLQWMPPSSPHLLRNYKLLL